ncbi:MAG: RNA polymerase sigma factor [Sphingobacteriales bacterium]|nr:RNA polymerase sigma factor [Sphingobacteriales bacterium]
MTEQEIIEGLKRGEAPAFSELVAVYQDRIFNTSLGLLQHTQDAEDIAQEVFIQVYTSIHSFKGEAKLSTWLYRIAVTKSLDFIRKKNRKKRLGKIFSIFGEADPSANDLIEFNHPGIQQEQKEAAAYLFKLVNQLPENQRIAFILNKIEGISYGEIADILKISDGAVDSLLQRAKQNLRKMIGGENSTG